MNTRLIVVVAAAGLVLVGVLVGSVGAEQAVLPAGNLVKNPGGDVPAGGEFTTENIAPAAWENEEVTDPVTKTVGPGVQVVRYGTHQSVLPRALSVAIGGGRNFFSGGYPSSGSKAFQVLDVSRAAAEIGAGGVKACLSAYLGGGTEAVAGVNMTAQADLQFLSADDAALGQLRLGPVTKGHRKGAGTLLRRASERLVPASTRKLKVTLTLSGDHPSANGWADNVSVALTKGNCEPVLVVKCVKKALVATVTPSAIAKTQRVRFAVKGGKRTKQVQDARAPYTSRFTMDGLTGKLKVTATVSQKDSGPIVLTKTSKRC